MNSKFLVKYKSKIDLITIIIPNPFEDTEIPICVVCFNGDTGTTIIYKNDEKLGLLNELEKERLKPQNNFWIKFNSPGGQIGLRAIDSSGKNKKIEFIQRDKFHYDSKKIKVSSRFMTYISIEENYSKRIDEICSLSNEFLEKYRERTKDIYLTPFKGNNKEEQRRRLDYKTARAILEEAILKINT